MMITTLLFQKLREYGLNQNQICYKKKIDTIEFV